MFRQLWAALRFSKKAHILGLVATDNHLQIFRNLFQLLLYILLPFTVDLVLKLANLSLDAASAFDEVDEFAELGVERDEQLVRLL